MKEKWIKEYEKLVKMLSPEHIIQLRKYQDELYNYNMKRSEDNNLINQIRKIQDKLRSLG